MALIIFDLYVVDASLIVVAVGEGLGVGAAGWYLGVVYYYSSLQCELL